WRRAELLGTDNIGCDMIFATGHRGYEKSSSGGASVTYTVQIDSSDALYCYFPSEWPREASLMLNGSKIGKYFDGQDFSIRELGRFQPGEIINAGLVLKKDVIYVRSGVSYFWYFDETAFRDAVVRLKSGVMNVYADSDERLTGTVTIPEGRELLFTTIPYDEGWKVRVDGRSFATISVLKDALLAVRIPAGEHEIEFYYDPVCVKQGWALTCAGCCVFAAGCLFGPFVPMMRKRKKTDD
ncbi:MAG: YfhO family protein, partial [Clostridia bacterium]|nr:YfhO family protein [Clostridia bacterium]